jgi:hypothetical protein
VNEVVDPHCLHRPAKQTFRRLVAHWTFYVYIGICLPRVTRLDQAIIVLTLAQCLTAPLTPISPLMPTLWVMSPTKHRFWSSSSPLVELVLFSSV